MKYVYILASVDDPARHHVGSTDDLRARFTKHDAGRVPHTAKFRPWRLATYIAFSDQDRAFAAKRL